MSFADSVDVRIATVGAEATLAQLVAVRAEMQAMAGQSVAVKMDTTAIKTAQTEVAALGRAHQALATKPIALGADTSALKAARTEVAAVGAAHQALGSKPVSLGMDTSQIERARTSIKGMEGDVLSLAGSIEKAAPGLALGVAAGALTKFASDYQTLLVTTANQTNMTTAEIATMDQTIRQLPSAGASLESLASGFKNITDLGYSAADAQKMANEESKAATATGSDQATTMLAITSAMKEYNATASEVAKYSNIVTEAARLGNTTLNAWTEGTRTGVAVAAAYGVSLQEADAFMVALTRHGFDASESATQLRGVIQHIVNETPKVDAEIQRIKERYGIDLSPDFGPDAIKVRGFTNIMQDLQDVVAKTGDESIVTKLIPALRGGQGALITVTQAAADSKDALNLLGQAADGSLTPVEDGFNRISQTAGYKFGTAVKQIKLDMIDLGSTVLPTATAILDVFDKIPSGAVKVAAEIGLAFAAIKTAGVVGDLLTATTARLGASAAAAAVATQRNAAAYAEEMAAAEADVAALQALNAARLEVGLAGNLSPSIAAALQRDTAIAEAKVAANVEVEAAEVVTAGAAAKVGAAVAGIGKALGSIVVPVAITVAATHVIGAAGLNDQLDQAAQNAVRRGPLEAQIAVQSDFWRQASPAELQANKDILVSNSKNILSEAQKELAAYEGSGTHKALSVFDSITGLHSDAHEIQLQTQVADAKRNLEELQGYMDSVFNPKSSTPDATVAASMVGPKAPTDEEMASLDEHYSLLIQKRDELLAQGAPANLVDETLFPQNHADMSKTALAEAKKDLALWEQQYKAVQTAATAAQTELGKVDVSKGIAGFANMADGLTKVNDGLAKVGKADSAISDLASIAAQFKAIADQTDAASAAYDGYTALLTNTNSYEKKLTDYKKELDQTYAAAQDAVAKGTATPEQVQLIKEYPNIVGATAENMAKLDAHKAGDVLAIAGNMPDWVKADELTRGVAQNLGGITAVDMRVTADKDQATKDVEELIAHPHVVTLQVQTQNQVSGGSNGGSAGGRTYGAGDVQLFPMPDSTDATTYGNQNVAPGGTATPRGNATALLPYKDMIAAAAKEYGVPEWLIGAAIMHESGGVAGAVNPTSGAAGLMQVYTGPGGNPQYAGDMQSLTGKDPQSASVQINDGTAILAAFLKQYGGDAVKALQGYAGTSYQSSADNLGVPPGLDFYTELSNYYKQPVDAVLSRGDSGTGGGTDGSTTAANPVGQSIVDAAMKDTGITDFVNQCEQWVELKVQAATGVRGATGTNEASATAAFNDAKSMGLVTKNPQKGDLVYYPSASGGDGHVAIYAGDGQQISTWDGGTSQIHTEAVGANAQYVHVAGVVGDANGPATGYGPGTYSATGGTGNGPATGYGPGTYSSTGGSPHGSVGNLDYGKGPANSAYTDTGKSLVNITNQARQLQNLLKDLAPKGGSELVSFFDKAYQAEVKLNEETMLGKSKTGTLTADQTKQADNAALTTTVELSIRAGNAMRDMQNHTGNVAADIQKIRDVGGPVADNLAHQVEQWGQIQSLTDKVKSDQAAATAMDDAHTVAVEARTQADRESERATTRAGWAQADADKAAQDAITQRKESEDSAWTTESRQIEDRKRALQYQQQLQQTVAQQQLTNLQKEQTSQVAQRTSAEQLVAAQIKGAATNQEAAALAGKLAGMHDADLSTRDANTKSIDDLQKGIQAEALLASKQSYDLETQVLAETRAHEDRVKRIELDAKAEQETTAANRTAQSRAAQEQKWQIEDNRLAEDAAYKLKKDQLTDTTKTDQANLAAANDAAKQTTAVEGLWEKIAGLVGTTGDGLLSAWSTITGQQVAAPSLTGPSVIRRLGGTVAPPVAIVPGPNAAPAAPNAAGQTAGGPQRLDIHHTSDFPMLDDAAMARIATFVRGEVADYARKHSASGQMAARGIRMTG